MIVQGWTRIAKAVNTDSAVANRVFYDILNEPDAFGLRWEAANGNPAMKDLYFAAWDAIHAVNPGMLQTCTQLKQQCMHPPTACSQHGLSYCLLVAVPPPCSIRVCARGLRPAGLRQHQLG